MDDNKKFWERCAKLYAPLQERSNRELYEELCRRCALLIPPGSRVLELACGTGQLTFGLCGRAAEWIAADFSPEMIAQAKKRGGDRARFTVEDATRLSFEGESFDVVLAANLLHIMPDPRQALAEMRRVLRPGGRLIIPTFVYEGNYGRLRIRVMEWAGFKTFHHWRCAEVEELAAAAGFTQTRGEVIPGKLLPEAFVTAVKPE